MKATAKFFILLLAVNLVILIAPQRATAQVSINFQIFYDDLSPYGDWINSPEYGYAWVPGMSSAFIPYRTNGHWVFTNVGWTWVSNYSWGWAPFHYGRWYYDSYYGWIWVPGYEWSPAWVIWRRSEGYYGWAPIGPGISITIAYGSGYRLPYNYWTCVRDRDFGRTDIYNHYVSSSNNVTIIKNSTVINNMRSDNATRVRYNAGPDRTEVQKRTGRTISSVTLRERKSPGQNLNKKELQLYRPQVEKNRTTGREPAPSKVTQLKDVKPDVQRNARTQPQRENQPVRQQQPQQQRNDQQRQQNDQPVKQQQRNDQQRQRNDQQVKQQQQQQAREQQGRQQQQQQQQQAREQQQQQQGREQQGRQQQQQAREQQGRQQQQQQQQQARQQQQHRDNPQSQQKQK
ncbi:DUF6600 domain-containing protein [Flavobacterium sp. JAS]|uniref:DUF6600 domain-containing protein n=1 Tax=Flavobacterium sp. JAS TaxID=2897329 RepID=UPI001E4B2666|nr:DUF6600 domain-containing protein [Flavobacterium sp. JAS]MCD0472470.1 hypothetical protein [Flavobacterium sp. JAS]